MESAFIKRSRSFLWRAGAFSIVAMLAYIQNIGDVAQVDPKILLNIFVGTLLTYVLNEVTKALNSGQI